MTSMPLVDHSPRATSPTTVFLVCAVIWLNVAATFNMPGRQSAASGLNSVALLKVAIRALSVSALGCIVFAHLRTKVGRSVVGYHLAWIAFVGWAVLSTCWSPLKTFTLGQAGGQAALLMLSVCIALTADQIQRYWIHCLFAIIAYCSVYGVGSVLFPGTIVLDRSLSDTLVHPTALGATSSLAVLMMIGLVFHTHQRVTKALLMCGIPSIAIALIVAHSRLAVVLAVVIGSLLLFAQGKTHVLAACAVLACLFGTAYLVFDPGLVLVEGAIDTGFEFLSRGQSTNQLTQLSGRSEMWTKMWNSYLDAPLIGHGYFVSSKTGKILVWFEETNHTAHNIALQALVSTGLIGLVLYVAWTLKVMQMLTANWIWSAQSRASRQANAESLLSVAVVAWFIGWTTLNASVLGPLRPESVVYAVTTGAIAGRYQLVSQGAFDGRVFDGRAVLATATAWSIGSRDDDMTQGESFA